MRSQSLSRQIKYGFHILGIFTKPCAVLHIIYQELFLPAGTAHQKIILALRVRRTKGRVSLLAQRIGNAHSLRTVKAINSAVNPHIVGIPPDDLQTVCALRVHTDKVIFGLNTEISRSCAKKKAIGMFFKKIHIFTQRARGGKRTVGTDRGGIRIGRKRQVFIPIMVVPQCTCFYFVMGIVGAPNSVVML